MILSVLPLDVQGADAVLEQQHLQAQQQAAVAVQSALMPPFKLLSIHTLYAVWGWLLKLSPPGPCSVRQHCPTSVCEGNSEAKPLKADSGATPHAAADVAALEETPVRELRLQGLHARPWETLARALHDSVCSICQQHVQEAEVSRHRQQSEVRLLHDKLAAYQVLSETMWALFIPLTQAETYPAISLLVVHA